MLRISNFSDRTKHFVLAIFATSIGLFCFAQAANAQGDFSVLTGGGVTLTLHTEKFAVKLKPGVTEQQFDELNTSYGVSVERLIDPMELVILRVPEGVTSVELRGIYIQHPFIEYANPLYYRADLPEKTEFTFPDELLVLLSGEAPNDALDRLNERYGVERKHTIIVGDVRTEVLRVKAPFAAEILELCRIYREEPLVMHASPNWIQLGYGLCDLPEPNDPLYEPPFPFPFSEWWNSEDFYFPTTHYQWYLDSKEQNGDYDIDAPQAWEISKGDEPVIIGIIDTGIYYHGDTPRADSVHNDFRHIQNGQVVQASLRVVHESLWLNSFDFSYDVQDERGHGTEMAGLAGAAVNNKNRYNGGSYAGIASLSWDPDVKILPIKFSGPDTIMTELSIILGLYHAMDNADIINMSWRWRGDRSLIDYYLHIAYHYHGCLLVAAAGNNNVDTVAYPASHPDVLAVGATMKDGKRWTQSSYGDSLDVVAPGVTMLLPSRMVTHPPEDWPSEVDRYDWLVNGTSFSAALTSGLAGLLLSYNPNLTNAQLKKIICKTAEKFHQNDPYEYNWDKSKHPYGTWNNEMGYGCINAYKALVEAQKYFPKPLASSNPSSPPAHFELHNNYPNPFNAETQIKYDLPQDAQVELSIYNILGQKVVELVNERKEAGSHTVSWNGRNKLGQQVSSGLYFYKLRAENEGRGERFIQTRKMLLLR